MDFDTNTLLLGLLFGSVGMGFFMFGKKMGRPIHIVAGLLLMVVPYMVPNAWALGAVGVTLTAVPFFIG